MVVKYNSGIYRKKLMNYYKGKGRAMKVKNNNSFMILRKIIISVIILTFLMQIPVTGKVEAAANPYANLEYYKVVNNIKSKYGISHGQISEEYLALGLAYVKLIDFDKNGRKELYLIYIKDETGQEVTQEIWEMKNDKAVKIFSEDYDGRGLASDRSLSLCSNKSKTYIKYHSQYTTGQADAPYSSVSFNTTSYLTLVNNKLVTVAKAEIKEELGDGETVKDRITYSNTQNSKTKKVTKKLYRSFIKSYETKGISDIIYGGIGCPAFVNVKNNIKIVESYWKQLDRIFITENLMIFNYSNKGNKIMVSGSLCVSPTITYNEYQKAKKGNVITLSGVTFKLKGKSTLVDTKSKKSYEITIPTKSIPSYFDDEGVPTFILTKKKQYQIDKKLIMKTANSRQISLEKFITKGGDIYRPEKLKSKDYRSFIYPTVYITTFKGKVIAVEEVYIS